MRRNVLKGLKLSRDFESVVSTISPLRQCWFLAGFRGFLSDYSASTRTIWTATVHKTLHKKSDDWQSARILPWGVMVRKSLHNLQHLFRWIYIWHLMLACVGFWSFSTMSTWGSAADVGYNPEGSPIPLKEMERAIEQSIWQHSSRYDVDAEYTGTTGEAMVDGKIIIRWEHLTYRLPAMIAKPRPGEHYAYLLDYSELTGRNEILGYAHWFTQEDRITLIKGEIVLNLDTPPKGADACLMELLVHETGHIFRGTEGHAENEDDVMYPYRGDCRYSLSLSDIQFIGLPLKSCHVELTPEGDLEHLDFKGQRIALRMMGKAEWGLWNWKAISPNPKPQHCNGIVVDGKDIFAEVKSFNAAPTILRLKNENGLFRSVPF